MGVRTMCRYMPEGSMLRCPVCASPHMVMLGMTYIHPSRCEATFVCDDDSCEGMLYTVYRDDRMVATFAEGSYGLFRTDGNSTHLRLEGEGNHIGFSRDPDGYVSTEGDVSLIPEDVLNEASREAAGWFARRPICTSKGEA